MRADALHLLTVLVLSLVSGCVTLHGIWTSYAESYGVVEANDGSLYFRAGSGMSHLPLDHTWITYTSPLSNLGRDFFYSSVARHAYWQRCLADVLCAMLMVETPPRAKPNPSPNTA